MTIITKNKVNKVNKTNNRINFLSLKPDEVLSETQFYKVVKVQDNKVQLRNENNEDIVVDENYVNNCLISASQWNNTVKFTKTELINLFLSSVNKAITVNFNKQVKEKDAKLALYNLYSTKSTEKDFKSKVDNILSSVITGEERTMVGRHYGKVDEFGRIQFIDMNITPTIGVGYDSRQRLVDTRTINYLIVEGIKYELK